MSEALVLPVFGMIEVTHRALKAASHEVDSE
jgi:hypothetical protein